MDISNRYEGDFPVLVLSGRLNQGTADALHAAAMEAADQAEKGLIVDMGGVDFIASVGIRALIRPSQSMAMKGGKLAIANLNPQMSEFFGTTGLDQMFSVYETVADAAAGIAS
ncbi:MAG: STAS domain-containing protein [Chthoniobacterales bacterium]|jgi:anti-anti-sigma factor